MSEHDIAVLGAGMHPWGKWGRNFVEYGVVAAQAALADAGVAWPDIQFVSGADTMRNGYPGYVAGATFAQALGWNGAGGVVVRRLRVGRHRARDRTRAQILAGFCDVALVIGADTTPKGFLAPNKGERGDDPDWLRFRLLGATNPTFFGLYARRRMELFGATATTSRGSRSRTPGTGSRTRTRATRRRCRSTTCSTRRSSPTRSACSTSARRATARPPSSSRRSTTRVGTAPPIRYACAASRPSRRAIRRRRSSSRTSRPTARRAPANTPEHGFKESIAVRAYDEAGLGPDDLDCAEVYDLSTAMELDWYEQIGLCAPGEAEKLLRDGTTTLGGRVPVNPSGGLACFGEAVPAQAIAQVCELTWQVQGRAEGRQVEGARVGLSINQGLFGHGSAVIVSR